MVVKQVVSVDLYCGGGGATQGMIDAGAKVVLSVDNWGVAETLHKRNYPDVPFVMHELGDDDADFELIEAALMPYMDGRLGYHIHIHGSPPCQAISAAKGKLYPEKVAKAMRFVHSFLRVVQRLKNAGMCDSWTMENVPPIRNHISPTVPHQMVMASDYGAPQNRYRYFAGEGWSLTKTGGAKAWDEVIDVEGLRPDALLNMGGAGESDCLRNTLCDRPRGTVANTTTSQNPTIRYKNPDGLFTKIRSITLKEKALLGGFPETYDLMEDTFTKGELNLMIANAVCPQAMSAIIRGLRTSLLWL